MAILLFEELTVSDSVLNVSGQLNPPANANGAMLQAVENDIRYTMDGQTDPEAGATGKGMVFSTGNLPEQFHIDDVKNMRVIGGAGSDAVLNVHWFGGRDV